MFFIKIFINTWQKGIALIIFVKIVSCRSTLKPIKDWNTFADKCIWFNWFVTKRFLWYRSNLLQWWSFTAFLLRWSQWIRRRWIKFLPFLGLFFYFLQLAWRQIFEIWNGNLVLRFLLRKILLIFFFSFLSVSHFSFRVLFI